ncbi:MAG: putative secreted hydrolase [Sulfitobacter sp.]|jgi:predicted secreted hydrolase
MNAKALIISLFLASPVTAQGFAGLGTSTSDDFAVPTPNPIFAFPEDHGPHPDYRIEWWYLTATLSGEDGQDYGIQWTLFRSALAPVRTETWDSPQIWMGHAGLTTKDAHFHAERLARDAIGQAGVEAAPFEAWIDDWQMLSTAGPDQDAISALSLTARGADWSYDLALNAQGPLVFQGEGGFSVKSDTGQASYYYSQPFYTIEGTLDLPSGPVAVTGQGWLDREWSSQPLAGDQRGWDWFSLQFEDGSKMMGFQLRDSSDDGFTSATWIEADGTSTALPPRALQVTPVETTQVEGREVPVIWRLELPEKGLDITTTALNPLSWMPTLFPYWEGPIRFEGTHAGRGYLEMTGYE